MGGIKVYKHFREILGDNTPILGVVKSNKNLINLSKTIRFE